MKMGQKIHPIGFRLALNRNWIIALVREQPALRDHAARGHQGARSPEDAPRARRGVERGDRASRQNARITVFSARPGVVIGKKGEDIEALKGELQKMLRVPVHVNIEEVRKPELDAQLIADSIAQQLQKRIMFRRAMKRAITNAMRLGAQGIKIMSAGPPERHRDRAHRVVSRRPRAAAHDARRHRLRHARRRRPATA